MASTYAVTRVADSGLEAAIATINAASGNILSITLDPQFPQWVIITGAGAGTYTGPFPPFSGTLVANSAQATTSGTTTLWTPTSGHKFNLIGFKMELVEQVAISGGATTLTIGLKDGSTDMALSTDFSVPATVIAGLGQESTGWVILPGSGILSATNNNALNITLSATLTTGTARVTCVGTVV